MGKVFLDKGVTLSELVEKSYEYHSFELSANSLHKITQNTEANKTVGIGLASIIITNAEDLKNTTFACASDTFKNAKADL